MFRIFFEKTNFMILLFFFIFLHYDLFSIEVIKGKVTDVTLYRNQALVVRTLEIKGEKGNMEVNVTDLPEMVVSESLSAKSSSEVQIHSVTYREKATQEQPRKEVEELDKKIEILEKQLRNNESEISLLQLKRKIITQLVDFSLINSKIEIQKGILKADEVIDMTDYSLKKHDLFTLDEFKLRDVNESLNKQLVFLRNTRNQITSKYNYLQKEAVIYLTKNTDGKSQIEFTYLVSNVSWAPQYNLRSEKSGGNLQLEYNAIIKQMSGEDWNGVTLRLSTSQPTYTSEPPLIKPLEVTLGKERYLNETEAIKELDAVKQKRYQSQMNQSNRFDVNRSLNDLADQEQVLEMTQKIDLGQSETDKNKRSEGVSVTYQIPQSVHKLASRNDEQFIQIATFQLNSSFWFIAAPVLTHFVYKEAKVKNISHYVFLPGPYNSYLNGEFVGGGKLPLVATGEDFLVGIGVEPQVQVKKEMTSKIQDIEGGNKIYEIEYKLTIYNYNDIPVNLKLQDRIPFSPDKQVRVNLISTSVALSKEPDYLQSEQPRGILRWDLNIPGQSVNEKAVTVIYRFRMAHEKNGSVKGLSEKEKEEIYQKIERQKYMEMKMK